MHDCSQSAYAEAAEGEPSPWSHLAMHSVVSLALLSLGWAVPTQAAAHVTSPASHLARQDAVGESEALVVVALSED